MSPYYWMMKVTKRLSMIKMIYNCTFSKNLLIIIPNNNISPIRMRLSHRVENNAEMEAGRIRKANTVSTPAILDYCQLFILHLRSVEASPSSKFQLSYPVC